MQVWKACQTEDFGKGIKKQEIHKLTEPFYSGNREKNVKGFGIGLTIVKKVIEAAETKNCPHCGGTL